MHCIHYTAQNFTVWMLLCYARCLHSAQCKVHMPLCLRIPQVSCAHADLYFVFSILYLIIQLSLCLPLCLFGIKMMPIPKPTVQCTHICLCILLTWHTSLYTLWSLCLDEAVFSPLCLHLHFAPITSHITLIRCFEYALCILHLHLYVSFVFVFCIILLL